MTTESKFKRVKSRKGMRTTTVTLPAEMHERLKVAAVKLNAPLTELVRRVLLDWLQSQRKSSR
jgi:hypothetical protein